MARRSVMWHVVTTGPNTMPLFASCTAPSYRYVRDRGVGRSNYMAGHDVTAPYSLELLVRPEVRGRQVEVFGV